MFYASLDLDLENLGSDIKPSLCGYKVNNVAGRITDLPFPNLTRK